MAPPKNPRRDTLGVDSENLFDIETPSALPPLFVTAGAPLNPARASLV